MSIGAGIAAAGALSAGASLFAGESQAGGLESGAKLIAAAQREATAESRRQYTQTREDLAPYREVGVPALEQYASLFGVGREGLLSDDEIADARSRFVETPGYEFRFNEGIRALDRSAAARGRLRGGGHERELIRYGQGIATDEFGNYANRLAAIAGMGQGATVATGTFGQQTAGNIGDILMRSASGQAQLLGGASTARASGYVGAANALSGGLSNYMLYDLLKTGGGSQWGYM